MMYSFITACLFLAEACFAAPLTINFQGIASGELLLSGSSTPVPFTNEPFTITFTTDTTNVIWNGSSDYYTGWVTGGSVTVDGIAGTYSTGLGVDVYTNVTNPNWSSAALMVQISDSSYFYPFSGYSDTLNGYDLQSSFGPLDLEHPSNNAFHQTNLTSFGSFSFTEATGVSGLTFTTTVPTVPEPASSVLCGTALLVVFSLARRTA